MVSVGKSTYLGSLYTAAALSRGVHSQAELRLYVIGVNGLLGPARRGCLHWDSALPTFWPRALASRARRMSCTFQPESFIVPLLPRQSAAAGVTFVPCCSNSEGESPGSTVGNFACPRGLLQIYPILQGDCLLPGHDPTDPREEGHTGAPCTSMRAAEDSDVGPCPSRLQPA